jgi:hypothetical protein
VLVLHVLLGRFEGRRWAHLIFELHVFPTLLATVPTAV